VRDVIGIHARDERALRCAHDEIGARRRPQVLLAEVQPNSIVTRGPFLEALGGPVRRRVIQDYELEIAVRLLEDTPDGRVEMRQRIMHRHYDAERPVARGRGHYRISARRFARDHGPTPRRKHERL